MIGKANEIKTRYVENFDPGFAVSDCNIPADAIITDIKFSTTFEDGYGIHTSALIIYKEASHG